MAKPITIPNTFASATSAIPLSQLDQDFSTLANSTNDLATYSNYVADTGAADAFIANYPANTNTISLTTGLRLQFKAANANTGASTLNVQVNGASIGTASIRLTDGSALPANTIIAGALVDVMYDGTNFQIMNDPSGGQEIISNLTLSGNLTVAGTSTFTGNVTGNVVNTTTSTITNLTSSNVTITGGTISNVTLDNVTVDVETFSNITINGTASFAAGSNTAPSITFTGDTNTGIYSPAADTIAFTEGGVESMRIDSSGNVGIGTSSPATILNLSRDSGLSTGTGTTVALRISDTSTDAGAGTWNTSQQFTSIQFSSSDTSGVGAGVRASIGATMESSTGSASALTFFTNSGTNTERMRIDSNGNVGIGTSAPSNFNTGMRNLVVGTTSGTNGLTIASATNGYGQIAFADGTTGDQRYRGLFAYEHGTDSLFMYTSGTERMRIDSSGKVLIGTTTAGTAATGITVYDSTQSEVRLQTASSGTGTLNGVQIALANLDYYQWNFEAGAQIFATSNTERMRIDSSGNVGIGVTPSAWGGNFAGLQTKGGFISSQSTLYLYSGQNAYYNGTNWIYTTSAASTIYEQTGGVHIWYGSASGTAGNSITFTERMRIDTSGNVGIGTTSISHRLTVSATGNSVASVQSSNSTSTTPFANIPLRVASNGSGADCTINFTDAVAYNAYIGMGSGALYFATNGTTERMRIDSSGNVGIGTSSPTYPLTVGNNKQIGGLNTSGAGVTFAIVNGSNNLVFGDDSTNTGTLTVQSRGNMLFNVNTAERMRITSGGEVYIAGTTDQGAYNLQVNGTGVWGAGAYVNGSDERIKDNIAPLDSGLDVVSKLNPVTYKYKEDWSKDQSTQTGFIAQELLTALEGKNYVDGVVQQGGEYMSVAYQNIIPILTKAIQEQQAMIEELKQEVALLKSK